MTKMTSMTTETAIQIQIESFNDYTDSDLDLDRGRFSYLVTQLTVTDKLRKLNHDIEGQ